MTFALLKPIDTIRKYKVNQEHNSATMIVQESLGFIEPLILQYVFWLLINCLMTT